jgi:hypothetical protein
MELSIIQSKIYEIRGIKVMLDFDLAEMYQVETRVLNQAIKRNIKRFPEDFMFQLSKEEWNNLKSQIVISSWGGTRKLPFAFAEGGVAMLSGLLNSDKAIDANINIMRAFIAMRNYILHQASISDEIKAIKERIKALEQADNDNLTAINDLSEDTQHSLDDIYIALSELASKQKAIDKPRPKVGYI